MHCFYMHFKTNILHTYLLTYLFLLQSSFQLHITQFRVGAEKVHLNHSCTKFVMFIELLHITMTS